MNVVRQILVVHRPVSMSPPLEIPTAGLEDCRLDVVGNAEEALAYLGRDASGVQLLLLDLGLPALDVAAFLRIVQERHRHVHCVLLARDEPDTVVFQGLKAGALDFIRLPQPLDVLRQRIRRCLDRTARIANGDYAELRSEVAGWVELTAPTDFEYVERFRTFTALLGHLPLEKEDIDDLRLAVDELGQNAIEWGNRGDRSKRIHMSYCIFHDRILLKVADEGEGFDPNALPDPSLDPISNLMARQQAGKRVGGYGIFLVRKVMDEVFHNETGNVVILVKRFAKRRPTPDDTH